MQSTHRYFPVNDAQRSWGLYATCAGHSKTEPGDAFPSPAHPDEYYFTWEQGRVLREWQLCLVEKGRGTVEFRRGRFAVGEGSLIVLPPGCWHRYRPRRDAGWTTLWIGFGGDLADRLVGGAGFDREGEVRDLAANRRLHRLFASAIDDMLRHGLDNAYSAAARIPLLVAALVETTSAGERDSSRSDLVYRAQSHIAEHASEIVDFPALAESLGVPYRTFRHVFAKETGTSPLQYQLGIRLARAKHLLRSSDMPVSEMAQALGFNSAWYFSRFFQRRVHVSATAYRKRHTMAPSML